MESFDFAEVFVYGSTVQFYCTDPNELDSVLKELQKLSPSTKAPEKSKLPSGESFHLSVDSNLISEAVVWWILKQLCQRDWEPLGRSAHGSSDDSYQLCRRNIVVS